MSKTHRDVKLFVNDILEAIEKIEKYIHKMSYAEFQKDEKTRDAVLRNLEIIGEAVRNIPEKSSRDIQMWTGRLLLA